MRPMPILGARWTFELADRPFTCPFRKLAEEIADASYGPQNLHLAVEAFQLARRHHPRRPPPRNVGHTYRSVGQLDLQHILLL